MNKNTCKIFNILILHILSFSQILFAASGRITGTVVDQQSLESLIGANILVVGTEQGAASDDEGHFIIENLTPGSYNIEIRYLGYATVKKNNVIINPNRATVVSVSMKRAVLEGEAIEVQAGYFEKAKEAVVSTRSMNFEEIRRSPGDLVDIQRAMQALPSVVSGSDQLNEIITRGGYPGENLFIMDNIEIPNPNHFAIQGAGGGPINLLNSYMVRNVDFYAGAFSARFGDRASSVMDISLRTGSDEGFRWEGSLGMAGIGALAEGPVSKAGSFMLSARKSYLDLIISSTGLTAVPRYQNMQGKLYYQLNDANSLALNLVAGQDKINIEGGDKAGYGRGAENVDTHNEQYIGGATLRTFWSKKLYSNTTLSAVQNAYFVDVYRLPGRKVYFDNHSSENEYTLKSDVVFQASRGLEMDFGAALKRVHSKFDVWSDADTVFVYAEDGAIPDSIIDIFRVVPEYEVYNTIRSNKASVYAQASWQLSGRIRATAGLRGDYFEYTKFHSWSPRWGFSWAATERTDLNFAFGRHFQSPYPIELISHPDNNRLQHKYADHFVFGIEHLFRDDVKLTVEVYQKTYRNVPVRLKATTPDPFDDDRGRYNNAGKGESRGIETFFQKKLTNRFSTIVSYAYSQAETNDPRWQIYYPSDFDYRHVFTFIGGYKYRAYEASWYQKMKQQLWYRILSWLPVMPADEFEVSLKWRYLGGRPYTEPVYHPELQRWIVQETARLNSLRYPPYHRLDIRLDRRFLFNSWSMVVFFDVVNIYNRDNIWNYQYNNDGSITKVYQYQTLPVGGVTLEF
ncbi:MAG: TonB-dependent receptor [Calditrichaeota bacterium]|nr:MAG: TonB-dependent receptor [Calditrichota bacterium]